jgi:acyl carrier protein
MHVDVEDVLTILKRELDLDEGDITAESTATDVELWDSLGHLRVCMALEERYGIQMPMEDIGELQSVPAIVKYLADS